MDDTCLQTNEDQCTSNAYCHTTTTGMTGHARSLGPISNSRGNACGIKTDTALVERKSRLGARLISL